MNAVLRDVARKLVESGIASPQLLQGCSTAELDALEKQAGVKLPRAYREFLATMGKSAGEFLCGSDFLYADLPPLRAIAEELVSESEVPLALDPADFVFQMHQGYTFLFFRCEVSDDPPVYLFVDDRTSFERVTESFSSWLMLAADDEIEAAAALRK
jgi:hypothetical protein